MANIRNGPGADSPKVGKVLHQPEVKSACGWRFVYAPLLVVAAPVGLVCSPPASEGNQL